MVGITSWVSGQPHIEGEISDSCPVPETSPKGSESEESRGLSGSSLTSLPGERPPPSIMHLRDCIDHRITAPESEGPSGPAGP